MQRRGRRPYRKWSPLLAVSPPESRLIQLKSRVWYLVPYRSRSRGLVDATSLTIFVRTKINLINKSGRKIR
ncbi:unnamed protein product, partial [Linum tenue]